MFYGNIKKLDIANGDGVRVSLFVSGCRNCCPGCFQPETWDFCHGSPFTAATEAEILAALDKPFVSGLTVLGGEPFEEENQIALAPFLQRVRRAFPQKTVWCYTGYVYEADLLPGGRKHIDVTDELLACIDVLVDGPFIEAQKDISLQFRGSRNQRILHLSGGKAAGIRQEIPLASTT